MKWIRMNEKDKDEWRGYETINEEDKYEWGWWGWIKWMNKM